MKKELSGKVGAAGAIRERPVLDLGELSEREHARAAGLNASPPAIPLRLRSVGR
jgi:hypothetical protein